MIKFGKEKVLLLHKLLGEQTGGGIGIRDEKLLDSALESVYQTFEGKELYPSKLEKAAQLCFALISNHAFIDGNKRIGMYVMLSFLEISGIHLEITDAEVVGVARKVAKKEMNAIDILNL